MIVDNIDKVLENSVILFVGAPLSGKGTQGNLLGKALKRPYVSSGDLFRNEVNSGSEFGKEIKKYMDNGELIPNELTTNFLTDKLSDTIYNNGMILDGYPRNLSHVEIFDKILINLNRKIFVVIYLNVSKSILDQRRTQRHRNDDDEHVFQRRYSVFQEETLPLIDFFKTRNILIDIHSNSESPEQIHQRILEEISNFHDRCMFL
jgi:adenylate kinase